MGLEEASDSELIEKYIETNEDKFYIHLYQRYTPLMYGLCLKYLKNQQDAQDAVVTLYEELSEKVKKHEISKFKNWLYSVTKYYCFAILNDKKKEVLIDFNVDFMEFDQVDSLLDEKEIDEEKITALNECMKKLPDTQRVCIEAFYMNDKSYIEIVEETSYNIKSVKSYIQNGRRNLKICLEQKLEN